MRMSNPAFPTINPRTVLEENCEAAIGDLLKPTGYVIQATMLRDLGHVLRSSLPWLIEGPRGGGKTALAEALAEACNLPVFYLQGMQDLTLGDVLNEWDREAQTQWVRQSIAQGQSFDAARGGQWTREFLKLGEALAAFECAAARETIPILICDEFDKVSEKIEDTLLQLFARGYAHIPRLGEIGVSGQSHWPIVILLSNDQRHDLSSPMRSRCLYSWLPRPTPQEEVRILKARCPQASRDLLVQMVKHLNAIQGLPGIVDKPGLRESIAFLQALAREDRREITIDSIESHLCFLAKRRLDHENLRKSLFRVELIMKAPDPQIDAWIDVLQESAA